MQSKIDVMKVDPGKIESPALRRLVEDVQARFNTWDRQGKQQVAYDRVHNRHNRSGYNRVHSRHNRGS